MSGDEFNSLIVKWAKRHGLVLLGFGSIAGYEGYTSHSDKEIEEAIRHQYVDQLIKIIHEDKAIETIQQKDRQQDRRIKAVEKDIEFILNTEL